MATKTTPTTLTTIFAVASLPRNDRNTTAPTAQWIAFWMPVNSSTGSSASRVIASVAATAR